MSDEPALRALAASSFNLPDLRDGQLAGMDALANRRDVLAVMPTGYGKSAIYQVAALHLHKATGRPAVVVSPLIALQEDQLDGLSQVLGPDAAVAINSSHSVTDVEASWQAAEDDFRPDYLALGNVREQLGNPPVAALTATASPPVRDEIVERLGMKDPLVLVHGFDRPNIALDVVRHHEDKGKRKAVVEQVADLARKGQGLLYAATRKDTEKYAAKLAKEGLRAEAYHAGRSAGDREHIHELFLNDKLDVVVATTAFGMGIDKPNVRFVVHADIPESLDSYYQEIGRAGRDREPASAVLHYRSEDLGLRKFFGTHSPDPESLLAVLKILKSATAPAPKSSLAELTGFPARRITGLVNQLEEIGAVSTGKRGIRLVSKAKLPTLVGDAVELAEARQRVDHSRLTMMRAYAETDGCRRQFLLGYFGEDLPEPCGNCDGCTAAAGLREDAAEQGTEQSGKGHRGKKTSDAGAPATAADEPFPLQSTVVHKEWGPGLVMRHEDDVITVLFEQEGYKTLSRSAVVEHQLLKPA